MKPIILTIVILTNVLNFEIAATRAEKEKGMMFRKSWGSIDGMIFINEEPEQVSYWMKNTYLTMDTLFLDNQCRFLESYFPEPFSTDLVVSSNTNIKYVLELKPAWTNLLDSNTVIFSEKLKKRLKELEKKIKYEE